MEVPRIPACHPDHCPREGDLFWSLRQWLLGAVIRIKFWTHVSGNHRPRKAPGMIWQTAAHQQCFPGPCPAPVRHVVFHEIAYRCSGCSNVPKTECTPPSPRESPAPATPSPGRPLLPSTPALLEFGPAIFWSGIHPSYHWHGDTGRHLLRLRARSWWSQGACGSHTPTSSPHTAHPLRRDPQWRTYQAPEEQATRPPGLLADLHITAPHGGV